MVSSYNVSSSQETSQHKSYLHSTHSKINKNKPQALVAGAGSRPQPKVYRVKPIHFRELVQKLTGATSEPLPQPRRSSLQSVAPPPLPLHQNHNHNHNHNNNNNHNHNYYHAQHDQSDVSQSQGQQLVVAEAIEQKPQFGGFDGSNTELTLSPNFQAWFTFAMLSPGPATMSQMEQSAGV